MKQIFFLHSAGPQGAHEGSTDFVSWLRTALGAEYQIKHPLMPNPDNPDYEPWKKQLDKEFKQLTGEVILIGHSIGGSVLVKYLSENKVAFDIKGLFLCAAPFWGIDDGWQYEPYTLKPGFADELEHVDNLHIYHSLDDSIVEFKHAERYRQELPKATLHALDGDSHVFESGIKQLLTEIR